jgi:hypothetical protein
MTDEMCSCAWCGAMDFFEWELRRVQGALKCATCVFEDCRHEHTYIDYEASNAQRARFVETCTACQAWRSYKFYFHTKTQRLVGPWSNDER